MYIDSDGRLNGTVAEFTIESEQTNHWSQFQRRDGAQSCCTAGAACLVDATVASLLVRYDATVVFEPSPVVKLHLFNVETRDIRLVNCMSRPRATLTAPAGPPPEWTFLGELAPYMSGSFSSPAPGWASYRTPMTQRMRMRRNGTFEFRLMDGRTDAPLDCLRVLCTVCLD